MKLKKIIFLVCIFFSVIVFAGENAFGRYYIDNIEVFEDVKMEQAKLMPTEEDLKRPRDRVVVINFEDSQWQGGGERVCDHIINELGDIGVTLVDRTLGGVMSIRKELELAERKGHSGYGGQDIADYAITGKITAAKISQNYDKNTGKTFTSGDVFVTIKVSQIPSLKTVAVMNVVGSSVIEGDSDSNYILSSAVQNMDTGKIKNQFAPTGYVLEHRIYDKNDHIFLVNMGKVVGVKPKQKVQFIKVEQRKNPITRELSTRTITVGEGQICEQLTDSDSFVVVKDKDVIDKIKLGDMVKVVYNESSGGSSFFPNLFLQLTPK